MQFVYGHLSLFLDNLGTVAPRLTATVASRFHTVSYLHVTVPTMPMQCLDSWHLNKFVIWMRHATYRLLRCPKFQEFALVKTLRDASGVVRCVAWSGGLLASGSNDKTLRVYDSLQDWGAGPGWKWGPAE